MGVEVSVAWRGRQQSNHTAPRGQNKEVWILFYVLWEIFFRVLNSEFRYLIYIVRRSHFLLYGRLIESGPEWNSGKPAKRLL